MKTLLLTLLLAIATIGYSQNTSCLQVDIMLVGDYSGSVDGQQEHIADAMDAFVSRFGLSEMAVKIGIVTFNSSVTLHSGLTTNKAKLNAAIQNIREGIPSGTTGLDAALYVAGEELLYGRKVPKLLVLITDGAPDNKTTAASVAKEIKVFGNITICGILVTNYTSDAEWLESICTDGCYSQSSYEALAEELKQLDICF